MKKFLVILVTCCLFSSCATLMNKAYTLVKVTTTKPSFIVLNSDTFLTKNNIAKIKVLRSEEPLKFWSVSDSTIIPINLPAFNSLAYYGNIFNYGIGRFFDRDNPKRYSYPKNIYINSNDSINTVNRYSLDNKKGTLLLHISIPYINAFQFEIPKENMKSNMGFWGLSLGLDYYHSENQYLQLYASAATDLFIPVPAPIDFDEDSGSVHKTLNTLYLSITNNHKINNFSFGYGLTYANNNWRYIQYNGYKDKPNENSFSSINLGLQFSSYYQIGRSFNIGIIYRPTFIRLYSDNVFVYEHLISLDLAWKIPLYKFYKGK